MDHFGQVGVGQRGIRLKLCKDAKVGSVHAMIVHHPATSRKDGEVWDGIRHNFARILRASPANLAACP